MGWRRGDVVVVVVHLRVNKARLTPDGRGRSGFKGFCGRVALGMFGVWGGSIFVDDLLSRGICRKKGDDEKEKEEVRDGGK